MPIVIMITVVLLVIELSKNESVSKNLDREFREKGYVNPKSFKLDCDGRRVSICLTFVAFKCLWLTRDLTMRLCHDFVPCGFLYDSMDPFEGPDCIVGFRTKDDQRQYRKWLRQQVKPSKV